MSPIRSPTLRDVAAGRFPPTPRRDVRALIRADPDLAPPARREVPLTAFA